MTNGLVNGNIGIESQFGQFPPNLSMLDSSDFYFLFTEALGLNKSAYVPPHLRNVQRAASNPSFGNG